MNSAVNVDEENLAIIKRLTEAADVCTMVFEGSKKWEDLLKQMSFFEDFDYFVGVSVKARNEAQMWFGSVESKLRHLTMTLRRCLNLSQGGLKLQEGVKMDINHFLPSLH